MIGYVVGSRAVRFLTLLAAITGIGAAGCASSPVTPPPPSPQVQEEQEPKEQEQAWNPFVVVEAGGRIFVTYHGGPDGSHYRLLFTRSLDGGATWLPEPVQVDTSPPPKARFGFHRLETDGTGKLSVTWSIEQKEGQYWRLRQIRNRRSSDFGASWNEEILTRQFDQRSNYPTVLMGRDGELNLLYMEGPSSEAVPRFIRTIDGGKAWAQDAIILPGTEATSPGQQEAPRRREVHWPALATDLEGALYAVWQESSTQGFDILFNRSQDGGRTWLTTSRRLSTHPSQGAFTSRIPVIAVDQAGGIYVAWEDSRQNTSDLYFNRSLDKGVTWLDQDLWVTAVRPPFAAAIFPILSADRSGHLYLLWKDIREAPDSVYYSRSLDRGASWLLQAIRLDRHDPKSIAYAFRLANDDTGHVYATWWEGPEATKGSVRFRRSEDYGATWQEGEKLLDGGQGKDGPRFPWLSADRQGGVYVVWSSDRSGRYQLYLNRSTDHGKTWLPQDVKITGRLAKVARGS